MRGDQFLHRREVLRLEVRRVQAQMDLFSKASRNVLQRHDFLGKELRLVIPNVDFADDQDGFARHQQLAILVVVLVKA